MAGWTREKREVFERSFYVFLNHCFINSKDKGQICLGTNLYDGQKRLISEILDALENDVHRIYVLKSRQLGISTLIRALSVFYLGVHKGLKGALLFDTSPHRESARAELVTMIRDLPAKLKFPKARGAGEGNRDSITFMNDSSILFLSAGVKRSKGSGTLGRSTGLSMHHASEVCSFENPEGMEAFEQSLSDINPDRLYIYESTARGFNYWWEIYTEAKKDPVHCKCIFLGFWAKESQRIERDSIDWALYGAPPLTEKEQEKIELVRRDYGVQIAPEQWAWFRRRMDPTARQEGDASPEFEGSTLKLQEQCVVEEDAWQQTGSVFFPAEKLTEITHKYVEPRFSTYMFITGAEFADMKVIKAPNTKNIDLKVWEEPDPEGVYCVGVDPAYGENPNNDRSSIQVLRCYADGVDQVAEYASPLPSTHQFAWVVASILGWYGSNNAQVRYALELNGPGTAVFSELRSLKHQIETGYQAKSIEEKGLKDVFRNVRTLIYNRADSIGVGKNYHIKTNTNLKIMFMERMRDFVVNDKFRIRSIDLLDEMKTIAREGDSIKAPGTMKDDRVLAASFAIYCWETGPRKQLVQQNRTRDAEKARKTLSITDQVYLFQQNQLSSFFAQKASQRVQAQRLAVRQSWRYR